MNAAFMNQKHLIKELGKKRKLAAKNYEKEKADWQHKKHCYIQAIAQHQATADHYKYQVRAYEQLARQNEQVKAEIEKSKKTKFAI